MCGIAGYIGPKAIGQDVINKTLGLMKNRGPDHQKAVCILEQGGQVHLLHSRLSIIDLDVRSNQPFERRGVWLVFNGEIYNYLEVRCELEALGVVFHTSSDTEVLIEAYLRWGEDCVHRFEGMWAFAIYDTRSKRLFLSRDRFAEKPLYIFEGDGGIYFGSEIKFLAALSGKRFTVNEQHLFRYLVNGYKSLYKVEDTFFREIKELPFASSMEIIRGSISRHWRYWNPVVRQKQMSMDESVEGFRHHLLESMRIRLRSDVPISFCLSGGVDSSALVSIAVKYFKADIHTFSIIDDDQRYDERENIQATIDDVGCKHSLIYISTENSLERLKQLVMYHDVPVATITFLAHSFITEAAAREGYKVIFAGHGADEMVTGYYDHFILHLNEMRGHVGYAAYRADWETHILPVVRNPYLRDPDLYAKDPLFRGHIYLDADQFAGFLKKPFREGFFETHYADSLLHNRMLNELFHEGVRLILHEDDLNAMKYSMENRCPYLDSKLFSFAYSIPVEHLMRDGYAKWILREAVKGILNDKVRLDRQKKGFNAGVQSLFDFTDSAVRQYLLDPKAAIFNFVDRDKIAALLRTGKFTDSYNKFVFNFINARIFLELYE
jgi:asparagine synthase (glutamine-hydrolysing)